MPLYYVKGICYNKKAQSEPEKARSNIELAMTLDPDIEKRFKRGYPGFEPVISR